jgi:hypothetical protein
VPSSQSESAPLLSQVLPAAAAAAEVTLLLPKQWCYLPVSQQLSVSIKVSPWPSPRCPWPMAQQTVKAAYVHQQHLLSVSWYTLC